MISVGIDMGSIATKAALFKDDRLFLFMTPSGWNVKETAQYSFQKIMSKAKVENSNIKKVIATGYGRVSIPFADRQITEITCHARGAVYLNPSARTVIDIGGQDTKIISVNCDGTVNDFIMNDKCAAGTGRFLQVMAHILDAEVNELDGLAERGRPVPINSMCTVFAESEIIGLLAKGTTKEDVASGILSSISQRVVHLASRMPLCDEIIFTGGVSRSDIVLKNLSDNLGMKITKHSNSQFAGAIGAALIGRSTT